MTFSEALDLVKKGERIARSGWNGSKMYVELQVPDEFSKMKLPYLFISPIDGDLVPWVATQSDLLAEDWSKL